MRVTSLPSFHLAPLRPFPPAALRPTDGTLQLEVWGGPTSAGKTVAVLFNKSPQTDTITVDWPALGLPLGKFLPVRDVWAMADLPAAQGLSAEVAPHGVRVFLVG